MNGVETNINLQLRNECNPDGSLLRKLQLSELDILVEFDRICRKHGIEYWLDFGTLLGAERHGGFIPWDDDIDVCMLKKDHKRFVSVVESEIKQPLQLLAASKKNLRPWTRIINTKQSVTRLIGQWDPEYYGKVTADSSNVISEKTENVWIDIFVVENGTLPIKRFVEKTYGKCMRRHYHQYYDGMPKYILAQFLYPFMFCMVAIIRLWCRLFHANEFVIEYGSQFNGLRLKHEIFPLTEMNFEGHRFKVPFNTVNYLERIYKNHSQIPPKEKRFSHGIQEFKNEE
ncbi:MAG: LicD family protein [Salinivirgaceae bacterium]|nr:LicD family protein [Salinivirgaceae bacterium]